MRILSWNIQWGRGCDGVVSLERIARVIREMGDFDLICLQEVAVNQPGLPGSTGEDQPALLAGAFPRYSAHYAIGSDLAAADGKRRHFGNLVLSQLPVLQVLRHSLPDRVEPGKPSMPRVALEAVVAADARNIRVVTTHLEYYSQVTRAAQIAHLRAIHEEAFDLASNVVQGYDLDTPFNAPRRPLASIYCGDFNCEPDAPEREHLTGRFANGAPALLDAWQIAHRDIPHAFSVGLHGCPWPDHPYCCDYFFVSENLRAAIRRVGINQDTAASDHQPIEIELSLQDLPI